MIELVKDSGQAFPSYQSWWSSNLNANGSGLQLWWLCGYRYNDQEGLKMIGGAGRQKKKLCWVLSKKWSGPPHTLVPPTGEQTRVDRTKLNQAKTSVTCLVKKEYFFMISQSFGFFFDKRILRHGCGVWTLCRHIGQIDVDVILRKGFVKGPLHKRKPPPINHFPPPKRYLSPLCCTMKHYAALKRVRETPSGLIWGRLVNVEHKGQVLHNS